MKNYMVNVDKEIQQSVQQNVRTLLVLQLDNMVLNDLEQK